MAQKTIEQDLLKLERRYWQAIKERDIEGAMGLTDDPCIVAGASGVASVDHRAFSRIMDSAKYTLNSFEVKDDAKVRMIGDDVAILAYNVHEDLTVDGKHVKMNAADSSVWVRRDGKWLCALHTESLLGDPYGRDRAHK
jgi:hypothetical protein